MSDKKFSDFTSINTLQDNEFLATELLGVENRKITFNDFAKQIQDRFLKLSYSDIGCIKSSLIAPSDNKQPNMIYCDGSTYYASNPNPLISKFINSVYQYEALRNFLQIPADKTSFKTPDLRNQHLVGAGSGNVAYQFITSKVMNFISSVSTSTSVATNITINNGGDHNHLMLSNEIGIEKPTGGTFVAIQGNFGIYDYVLTGGVANPTLGKTSTAGAHTHPATASSTATSNTALAYNNSLIDTINRVPALAVYHYIDIAVDRFNLDPNATGGGVLINISDVIGLQNALDLKADLTDLDGYATIIALDTGLSMKASLNHSHPISDINGLQLALDGKSTIIHNHLIGDLKYDSSTSLESWLALTYATISHSHNISAINGLQNALNDKANTTDLDNYLKKDGSTLLDNTYIPSDNFSIATKGYVDNSAPNLSNYLEKGGTYNFTGSLPGIVFTNSTSTTTLFGTGLEVKRNTRRVFLDDSSLIWFDGSPEFNKFSINTFNANFTYKATSTSTNTIWKMDSRQITDDILTPALVDNSIVLKKDIIGFNKKRNFNRSWATTTAGTIAGNASVRILDRLAYNPILGIEPLNTTFNYTSGTNSFIKELNDVDLPDKILRVILRVKNNAAMGNTQLEFSLFRQSDNTEVGGADNVVINDPDTRGISFELSSRSFGATDSFVLTGYYVVIRNLTPTALAYNNIELLIQVSRDIGY